MDTAESNDELVTRHTGSEGHTVNYDHDRAPPTREEPVARPTSIGRYIVLDLIGVGGMGMVCTAYDPKLDRKVALKLLRRQVSRDDSATVTAGQARLFREAQALAKLSHPNVITVHDVDTHDGQLYIAMEYVEGKSLKDWMREKQHSWREVLNVFTDAGRGLAAAHAAGLTHRDFKPGNVILGDDGRVRVVDFGLVKGKGPREDSSQDDEAVVKAVRERNILTMVKSASDLTLTQDGRSVGTPAYMAPEQHMGLPVGPQADQFAFCVSLYEALYGRLPFGGDTVEEQFRNIIEGNIREPSKPADVPPVPPWIHRILLRGLHAQPKERFPSMEALLVELAKDPAKRRKRWMVGGAMAAVFSGMFGWGLYAQESAGAQCSGAEERLVGIWDDERKSAIEASFLATGKPYAQTTWELVEQRLDQYTQRWADTHQEVCEASHVHHDQSDALMDVRMACLKRGLDEAKALSELFAHADGALVQNASKAVLELPDLEKCASMDQPSKKNRIPDDPKIKAAIEGVQRKLAKVRALLHAGKYEDSLPVVRKAVRQAKQLGHAPTTADALLLLAESHDVNGDHDAAADHYREAIRVAAESGVSRAEATAWAALVYVVGYRQHDFETGEAYAYSAEVAMARAEAGAQLRAVMYNNLGALAFERGRAAEAREAWQKAVDASVAAHGEESQFTSAVRTNLASALARLREYDQARKELETQLEYTKKTRGPKHPETATIYNNLGNVLTELDEAEMARSYFQRALEIRQEALEDDHPKIGESQFGLGVAHRALGNDDEALRTFEKAIAFWNEHRPGYKHLSRAHRSSARLLAEQGRYEEAIEHYGEIIAQDPRHADAWIWLCDVQRAAEKLEDALSSCKRGLELHQTAEASPSDRAEVKRSLGRTLVELERFSDGAQELLSAIELWREAGAKPSKLAALQFEAAKALHRAGSRTRASARANAALDTFRDIEDPDAETVESWLTAHGL